MIKCDISDMFNDEAVTLALVFLFTFISLLLICRTCLNDHNGQVHLALESFILVRLSV